MNITSQKYGTAAGLALLAVASAWGGTVYRPGATQGWYEKPTEKKNTTDFTVDIRSLDAARIDRTLGFNMADFRAENASSAGWLNPLSGITWKWHQNYMTYAYDGYIRLDEGAVYMMHTRADDGAAVEIDGAFAINQGTGSGYDNCTAATYTHDRSTGWYPVRAFAWDWDGGKGPAAVNTYGLAWNTNGVAGPASGKNSISTTSTDWSGFYDTGDMTFLKTRTDESFTAISGLGTSGDDLVIGLSVGALPQDAELYVLFGSANAGIATPEWWDSMVLLGTLGGGTAYSTNFTVSAVATGLDLATEPVVCLYLKGVNPADTATMFEEWLTPFTAVAEAEATIAVAEVNYTDATFAVTVSSMGVGAAAIASVSVDIATDEEFQNIVQRIVDATGTNAVPTIFVLATQDALLTNTTYHARAVIVNDQAATSYSEQTDFTTLEPTAPVFSAIGLVAASFDGGTFSFMLADYGDDSTNAVVTFEISETPDFSTVMSFDVANVLGTLPHTARGTATGLDAGTTYHARFRAVNTWLLDSVSESPMFETRATPFRTSAIGAVAESGGTEVSISVTDIFAGATVSAELFIGATEATATRQASWQSVAEGAPLAFTYTGALSTFVAKYVITAAYGGGTYPVTVTASVSVGNTVYAPATLADTVGYRLRAGDTLVLPEPATTLDYYLPLNLRVAELQADGRTVKAVGPGASGIEYYSYASGSSVLDGTGGIIVVPDPVGSGRVFIFNENASSWNWSNAANWECVTDPGHAGYPNAVDDVAMVIYYTQGGKALTVGTTAEPVVTVGELYVGQITSVATSLRFQGASSEERTLNFQRSTRDPALVQVTGGAKDSLFFDLNMGGSGASSALDVRLNGAGLDIDLGYTLALLDNSFKSNNLTRVNTQYSNIHVPAGSTYRLANGPSRTRFWGDSQQGNVYIMLNSNTAFHGAGTVWQDTASTCTVASDFSNFSGLIRSTANSAVRGNPTTTSPGADFEQRQSTFFMRTSKLGDSEIQTAGYVTSSMASGNAVGTAAWGHQHSYGAQAMYANRLPERGVTLSGGYLTFSYEEGAWGSGTVQTQLTQRLTLDKGLSAMHVYAYTGSSSDRPTNTVTALSLANRNKGTLYINESRTNSDNPALKSIVTLGDFAEHAVGGTGDLATEAYPVIPWIVARWTSISDIMFAAVNAENQMQRPVRTSVALDTITDPLQNAYVDAKTIALTTDRTVNTLTLVNTSHGKRLGEGRTLTITSGGLIMRNNSTRVGEQTGGAANGSLVFGDTAYVYPTSTSTSSPNEIWSTVTAPKGFVLGYYGNLVLAGDQTGIDDEIVVNNGTLMLGSIDGTVKADIGVDIRIVGGNAKVKVNVPGTLAKVAVHFDDTYQYGGQLILPDNQTETCHMLFVGDSEKSLPRGTYGATGSGAQFIDDDHFAGTGVLRVLKDNLGQPTILMLR